MSFATWQSDDCDKPDWREITSAITSLAQSANSIAADLQAPADAVTAYIVAAEQKIRRRLDSQAKQLVKRVNDAADLIYGPLMQSANAQVDAIRSTVTQVHAAVLRAGRTDIPIPPLLGSVLAAADALAAAPETPGEYEPAVTPDDTAAAVPVYMVAPGQATAPQAMPDASACCPTPQQRDAEMDADFDQPNVLLFGERPARWHAAMRAFYEGALDPVLDGATLSAVIAARTPPPTPVTRAYPTIALVSLDEL